MRLLVRGGIGAQLNFCVSLKSADLPNVSLRDIGNDVMMNLVMV